MYREQSIIVMFITLIWILIGAQALEAQTLVSCSSPSTCTILIYNSGAPQSFTVHTLTLIPPQENGENVPISGTAVTVNYDGTESEITCDDTWHTGGAFPGSFSEITDRYSCTVTSAGTAVIFQLQLYAQDVYDHPYNTSPSLSVDPHLAGTSETSPFCITDNTTADAEACKWQEQNLNDTLLNQRGVPLNDWVVYARTNVNNLKLAFQVTSDQGYSYNEGDYICMVDVNGDGDIGEDETATCINTSQGYFCPIQAVQCVATYSDPTCPQGGSLNTDTDKCEATPNTTCLDGYTYNQQNDVCLTNALCPDGGGLNPSTDLCEIVISNSCPSGFTYDESLDACLASPTCTNGGTFNPSSHKCEVAYTPSCSAPYTYNSSSGNCEAPPECPSGSSYDPSADKCVKSTSPTCPTGYTYNSSTGQCEASPECPTGGSYNSSTKQCEATAQWKCPLDGQTYSSQSTCNSSCSQNGTCSSSASCSSAYCNVFIESAPPGWPNGAHCDGDASASYPTCPNNEAPNGYDVGQCDDGYDTIVISYKCNNCFECSLTGQSYCDSTTCQNNCHQSSTCSAVCPTGYSYNGSVCVATPTCPTGGSFSSSSGICDATPTLCSSPFVYNAGLDRCVVNASCPSGGSLNTTLDVCTTSIDHDCPTGYTYDSNADICQADPECSPGYFDSAINECRVNAASMCPTSYTFNSSTDKCEMAPQCPSPSTYSSTLDQCQTDATHDCPDGYNYSTTSRLCEADPECQAGTYDPQQNQCYEGDNTCPLGSQYQCYDVNGTRECSPNTCQQFSSGNIVDEDTPQGADDKKDDGQVDANGNCLGTLYIFNGKDMRCRKAGLQTGWFNCCSQDETWFGLGRCEGEEEQLVTQRKKGLCHYVDTYCAKSWPLIGCVQRKKTYCCFNSKLGRIIQEQGRPMLKSFGPTGDWGSGKHPNCRGFTPDEFQMLDFDRMDLSEWYGDIVTATQQQIGNTLQNKIQNFYDSTQ